MNEIQKKQFYFKITCIFGALAIIIGAFAAHGLKKILPASDIKTLHTGVNYQFYHVLALLFCFTQEKIKSYKPIYFFLTGIVLFSGSLYLLAIFHLKQVGFITPLGGISFILGWIFLAKNY